MHSNGGCPWHPDILLQCTNLQSLEVLKFAINNGCPFDIRVMTKCIENGNFISLLWVLEKANADGLYIEWRPYVRSELFQIKRPDFTEELCTMAITNGFMLLLEYGFKKKNYKFAAWTCALAAQYGQLQCLKYLRETARAPWDDQTCLEAARNGHKECLAYACAKLCPWDSAALHAAVSEGHAECLKSNKSIAGA